MKQLDCWIIRRSSCEVGGRRYCWVRMVYQPAVWFSTREMVPSEESQRSSSVLAFSALAPPAAPVATVLASGEPMRMSVVTQPVSATAAMAVRARYFFTL